DCREFVREREAHEIIARDQKRELEKNLQFSSLLSSFEFQFGSAFTGICTAAAILSTTTLSMWQVAVAAAMAGSGLLAKHLFTASQHPAPAPEPLRGNEEECHSDHFTAEQTLGSSPPSPLTPLARTDQAAAVSLHAGGEADRSIFRFSSSDSGGNSRSPFKIRFKKTRVSAKATRASKARTMGGLCKGEGVQGKRLGGRDGRKRVSSVRRVSLLFKKRKTGKNCTGKRDFFCSTDSPSFGWGLGIGIMYMMSAGKEEISKLSYAVDETAKVVHELKTELHKRRSHYGQSSGSSNGGLQATGQGNNSFRRIKAGPSDTKAFSSPGVEDGEGASSILTEELLPEGTEMDWLEAEFESELLKLPTFVNHASNHLRITGNCIENKAVHESECQNSTFFQPGVSPAELTEKLSDVLIKQQGNQISELESELKSAYSKLQQKEAELDTLKDCVKRLTEFSLSTTSGKLLDPLVFNYDVFSYLVLNIHILSFKECQMKF
ncbi:hypothetical protein V2J09_009447, partial [Rumex salicifolius]